MNFLKCTSEKLYTHVYIYTCDHSWTVVGGGEKSLLSDPLSELRLRREGGRKWKKKCEGKRWDERK